MRHGPGPSGSATTVVLAEVVTGPPAGRCAGMAGLGLRGKTDDQLRPAMVRPTARWEAPSNGRPRATSGGGRPGAEAWCEARRMRVLQRERVAPVGGSRHLAGCRWGYSRRSGLVEGNGLPYGRPGAPTRPSPKVRAGCVVDSLGRRGEWAWTDFVVPAGRGPVTERR
jgi:hypothetical protein